MQYPNIIKNVTLKVALYDTYLGEIILSIESLKKNKGDKPKKVF